MYLDGKFLNVLKFTCIFHMTRAKNLRLAAVLPKGVLWEVVFEPNENAITDRDDIV